MDKENTRRPLSTLIPNWATHISQSVESFAPENNQITLSSGDKLSYEYLVVASGIQINWSAVKGLPEALVDSNSGVSSIYSYATADKAQKDIAALRSGKAIFTQPSTPIKCAGGLSFHSPHGYAHLSTQLHRRLCGKPGICINEVIEERPSRWNSGLECPPCFPFQSTRRL